MLPTHHFCHRAQHLYGKISMLHSIVEFIIFNGVECFAYLITISNSLVWCSPSLSLFFLLRSFSRKIFVLQIYVSCCEISYVLNAFVDFPWKLMKLREGVGWVWLERRATQFKNCSIYGIFPFPPCKRNENEKKAQNLCLFRGWTRQRRKFVIAVAKIKCKSTNSI